MNRTFKVIAVLIVLFLPVQVLATPKIQHWQLKNGSRVYFVESHTLPMVQVIAAFNAGSARDPQNRFGLALMTNHLLKQGAAGMSTDEIARGMEDVGAELDSDVGRDMATIGIRTLSDKDKLAVSSKLLSQIITQPTFSERSLDRERSRLMVALQSKKQSPGDIASDLFYQLTYPNHPYGHPEEGTNESIARITQKDLVDFHHRYYVGRNAVLAIMGDLNRSQARTLSREILGTLPAGKPAALLPAIEPATKGITEARQFDSEARSAYAERIRTISSCISVTTYSAAVAWYRGFPRWCVRRMAWHTASTVISGQWNKMGRSSWDCKPRTRIGTGHSN